MWIAGALCAADNKGVKITELDGKLRVELDGELFTEYIFKGAPHVYFYPIIGPGGTLPGDWGRWQCCFETLSPCPWFRAGEAAPLRQRHH